MAYSRTTSLSPIAVNPSILSSNSTTSSTFGMVATQVSFNPSDNTQICVTGNGIFKLFRYQEGALKQLTIPKYEMRVYTNNIRISFVIAGFMMIKSHWHRMTVK